MVWRKGNGGPVSAKPPYKGDVAFSMGWPEEPPFQLKWKKKCKWRAEWRKARYDSLFPNGLPHIVVSQTPMVVNQNSS